MQKLITFYGKDSEEVTKLLGKGWTVSSINTTASSDGIFFTTVLLEEPAEEKWKKVKQQLNEQLSGPIGKEFNDLVEFWKNLAKSGEEK